MEIFVFSLGAVAPVIIIAALGWALRRVGLLSGDFIPPLNNLCYYVLLPIMLFNNTYTIDFTAEYRPQLVGYSAVMLLIIIASLWVVLPFFIRDRGRLAVTVNAAFRSNFVIYAIPVIAAMYGAPGVRLVSMLTPIAITMFNVIGVIVLRYYSSESKTPLLVALRSIIMDVVKNPLIIASVLGISAALLNVTAYLPSFALDTVATLGAAGTPVGLILMGTQLDFQTLRDNKLPVVWACVIKLVFVPVVGLAPAILLGFRGVELGALLILFGAPSPVVSAIMARRYNIAPAYAAQLVVATTVFSAATLFFGISLLRMLGLI